MHFLLVIFTARQYIYNMTVTQTVDIPASRRLTIDVPREVPVGWAILAFTPASDQRPAAPAKTSKMTEAREIELINRYADRLNKETLDVLSYQNLDL